MRRRPRLPLRTLALALSLSPAPVFLVFVFFALVSTPASAGGPGFKEILDPLSGAFPEGASRRNLRREAFDRAVADAGIARAIRYFDDFEKHLEALDERIAKDHAVFQKVSQAWWGWRRKHEQEHMKRYGRMPAEYPTPEGLNREFLDKEEAFKTSRSLKLRERLFHEWVLERVVEEISRAEGKEREAIVRATAKGLRDRNEAQRLRCAHLLARVAGTVPEAREELSDAIVRERHPVVRGALVAAASPGDELGRHLADDEWPVRAGAILRARALGDVDALIGRLESERGRLRDDATDALRSLTGQELGSDATAWRTWWEGARDAWKPSQGSEVLYGDPRAPEDRGELAQTPGVFSDGPGSWFGIATSSRALVYCVEAASKEVWPHLRDGLLRSLDTLPDDAEVGIVLFDGEAHVWRRKLAALGGGTRESAKAFVQEHEPPGGGADLYAGLRAAIELARARGAKPAHADTLLLATVQGPNGGVYDNPRQVQLEVGALNALQGLRIHAIGPSEGREAWYLQNLCRPYRGTHRQPGG